MDSFPFGDLYSTWRPQDAYKRSIWKHPRHRKHLDLQGNYDAPHTNTAEQQGFVFLLCQLPHWSIMTIFQFPGANRIRQDALVPVSKCRLFLGRCRIAIVDGVTLGCPVPPRHQFHPTPGWYHWGGPGWCPGQMEPRIHKALGH